MAETKCGEAQMSGLRAVSRGFDPRHWVNGIIAASV